MVLQQAITTRLTGFHGGISQTAAIAAASPHTAPALAQAFGVSFAVPLGITAVALVPTILLPGRPTRSSDSN